jgi:hypothetical protein
MKVQGFPMCCNAHILNDFGGTQLTSGKKKTGTYGQLLEDLDHYIKSYGNKCLVAFTNSEQVLPNKALRYMGFKHSVWMSKAQHPETKLRLWWREPNKPKK